jgi:hypothetical protein
MPKRTIAYWWILGLAALGFAVVLVLPSALALAAHVQRTSGRTGSQLLADGYVITVVVLILAGGILAMGGVVAQLVAWVGAVLNAHRLASHEWFALVLWGGIVGIALTPVFGIGTPIIGMIMVAYLVAAPDATATDQPVPKPDRTTVIQWAARGFALAGAGLVLSLAIGLLRGPGRLFHELTWLSLAVQAVGLALAVTGAVIVSAAWWGAVLYTYQRGDQAAYQRRLWTGIIATLLVPFFGLGALVLLVAVIMFQRSTAKDLQTTEAEPPPMPAS